jgi:hypothetical protein
VPLLCKPVKQIILENQLNSKTTTINFLKTAGYYLAAVID